MYSLRLVLGDSRKECVCSGNWESTTNLNRSVSWVFRPGGTNYRKPLAQWFALASAAEQLAAVRVEQGAARKTAAAADVPERCTAKGRRRERQMQVWDS